MLYTSGEYYKDVRTWCQAISIEERRQGPLLRLAVGGQARIVVDKLEETRCPDIFVAGGYNDDGHHEFGPLIICKTLIQNFPPNDETLMLRSGLEFLNFCKEGWRGHGSQDDSL